jgi:hypothetical protein
MITIAKCNISASQKAIGSAYNAKVFSDRVVGSKRQQRLARLPHDFKKPSTPRSPTSVFAF